MVLGYSMFIDLIKYVALAAQINNSKFPMTVTLLAYIKQGSYRQVLVYLGDPRTPTNCTLLGSADFSKKTFFGGFKYVCKVYHLKKSVCTMVRSKPDLIFVQKTGVLLHV